MLARMDELPRDEEGWAFEIKWDGVRVLGFADHGKWRMQSRRLEEVTARYPELVPIAERLAGHAAVLDGEVVSLDDKGRPSFQLVQRRMGLTSAAAVKARARETPVDFMIFDLLHLAGRHPPGLPYTERPQLPATPELTRPATASAAEPSCSRRRSGGASRVWSPSASTVPTGPASGPASGSSGGSGAARSS